MIRMHSSRDITRRCMQTPTPDRGNTVTINTISSSMRRSSMVSRHMSSRGITATPLMGLTTVITGG